MKKLFCILCVVFGTTSLFCEVFKNSDKIVETFWKTGSYIKIVKDGNNICYFYKSAVTGINIDENDMEISSMGHNPWTDKNGDRVGYNVKKWTFRNDTDGNIIIEHK